MYARRYAFLHEEDNIHSAIGIEKNRGDNLDSAICAEVDRMVQDNRDMRKSEGFERILNVTIPTNEVEAFYAGYMYGQIIQKMNETNAQIGAPDKQDDHDPPTHFIVFDRSTLIELALFMAIFIIDICVTILS